MSTLQYFMGLLALMVTITLINKLIKKNKNSEGGLDGWVADSDSGSDGGGDGGGD